MLPSVRLLARSRGLLQRSCRPRYASRAASQPAEKANKQAASPEDMEKFMQMTDSNRLGFDPWGQPMPTLEKTCMFQHPGLENRVSNVVAMYRIARSHSLPWNPTVSPWSPQIFRTSSTKPNTWLEPLRETAFESYAQINTAVAANDRNVIRALTEGAYQKLMVARMKTLHPTTSTKSSASFKKASLRIAHVWRLHSLASPVRCVSLRGIQGHFGRTEPALGTRWVVQACLRFDTWQSLATFSPSSSLPPEPKRVLEYLVFEKRMWYGGPWVVRDQLWEGTSGQYEETSSA